MVDEKIVNMKKRIGIIGSRRLACNLLRWVITQDVIVVGVVPPPFNGWWNDEFGQVARELRVEVLPSLDLLLENEPDVIFSINYWKKISTEELQKVNIVNIHHSYRLKYKGRYSTSWAIINSRKTNCNEHGTSLHYIDENLDEGEIIDSQKCIIEESDTAEILFEKVELMAEEIFKSNFHKIINNEVKEFVEKDPEPLFYDINSNKNMELDYGIPLETVYDFVRAWSFKDRPKPFFKYKDYKIYLTLNE